MSKKKKLISNKDLAKIVENEGLGYAFTCYIESSEIEDLEIRKLARIATDALLEIEAKLDQL